MRLFPKQFSNSEFRPRAPGFTIIEIMLAIMIFMMVLTAMYATWMAILKGTRAGLSAAADVQRSRIAVRAMEDAFLTVEMFNENMKWYSFLTDTKGDFAAVSMVSRLPASFPGVGHYGDQVVRRVSFFTQPGTNNSYELVMSQTPMLMVTNEAEPPYSLVLARDVTLFSLEFYDLQKNEWLDEWRYTNALPKLVRASLGLGKVGGSGGKPRDIVSRIIALPASAVAGVQAGPGMQPAPGLQPGTGVGLGQQPK